MEWTQSGVSGNSGARCAVPLVLITASRDAIQSVSCNPDPSTQKLDDSLLAQRAELLPAEPLVDARLVELVAAAQGERDLALAELIEADGASIWPIAFERHAPPKGLRGTPAAHIRALRLGRHVCEHMEHALLRIGRGEGGAHPIECLLTQPCRQCIAVKPLMWPSAASGHGRVGRPPPACTRLAHPAGRCVGIGGVRAASRTRACAQ